MTHSFFCFFTATKLSACRYVNYHNNSVFYYLSFQKNFEGKGTIKNLIMQGSTDFFRIL